MKYLLDSHILIWALFMEEKLPGRVRDIINQPENEIYYSPASVWEIGLKHQKAPEKMPVSGELLMECCEKAGMASLPIVKEHAIAVNRLQRRENEPPHNDPFDRILLAQAKERTKFGTQAGRRTVLPVSWMGAIPVRKPPFARRWPP